MLFENFTKSPDALRWLTAQEQVVPVPKVVTSARRRAAKPVRSGMQFSGHKAAFIGSATVDDNPPY
ncbi:hypothetical protein V1478_003719 [Vespula squamosa]|uniref:Uncharacterized protein n=1 Tax=Vespula squamosa TaxID=30214 RepID=A0ABD2BML4_VESSQ